MVRACCSHNYSAESRLAFFSLHYLLLLFSEIVPWVSQTFDRIQAIYRHPKNTSLAVLEKIDAASSWMVHSFVSWHQPNKLTEHRAIGCRFFFALGYVRSSCVCAATSYELIGVRSGLNFLRKRRFSGLRPQRSIHKWYLFSIIDYESPKHWL